MAVNVIVAILLLLVYKLRVNTAIANKGLIQLLLMYKGSILLLCIKG